MDVRFARWGGFGFLCLALVGCGGGLGNLLGIGGFQGTWQGSAVVGSSSGTMYLNIDQNDNVTGTDTITIPGQTTTDSGSISSSGSLTLNTSEGGVQKGSISANLISTGSTLTGSGTLSVNGTQTAITSIALTNESSTFVKPRP